MQELAELMARLLIVVTSENTEPTTVTELRQELGK